MSLYMRWYYCIILLIPLLLSAQEYSLRFDAGSRIDADNSPELNPQYITLELWLNLDIPQAIHHPVQNLLSKSIDQDVQYSLFLTEGKPSFSTAVSGGGQVEYTSDSFLQPLLWHHLSLSYDGENFSFTVNGVPEYPINPLQGTIAAGSGSIMIGNDVSQNSFQGSIDGVKISSEPRYIGEFDPYTPTMNDVLPFDQEIPGWIFGTGPFDHLEADDSTSLYLIIDGAAPIYLRNNFQYAIRQNYYGEIGGNQEQLDFWFTDQGDSLNAAGLYHDPLLEPASFLTIEELGDEARLDLGALFDYTLDMHYDRYYLSLTASKENDPAFTEQLLMDFAENAWNAMKFLSAGYPDSTVVLDYSFEEGSGTIAFDSSYYQNHGAIVIPQWTTGCDLSHPFYIYETQASDGIIPVPGIDEDDKVEIRFNILLTALPDITTENIDSVLRLSDGHSWLSGSGQTGPINWMESAGEQHLEIMFSLAGGSPTVSDGDTIFPEGLFNSTGKEIESYCIIEGEFGVSSVKDHPLTPNTMQISPPHPNPFNQSTVFQLVLSESTPVKLSIYNLLGEMVDSREYHEIRGDFIMKWSPENLPSGLYFARIEAGSVTQMYKLVIIK